MASKPTACHLGCVQYLPASYLLLGLVLLTFSPSCSDTNLPTMIITAIGKWPSDMQVSPDFASGQSTLFNSGPFPNLLGNLVFTWKKNFHSEVNSVIILNLLGRNIQAQHFVHNLLLEFTLNQLFTCVCLSQEVISQPSSLIYQMTNSSLMGKTYV